MSDGYGAALIGAVAAVLGAILGVLGTYVVDTRRAVADRDLRREEARREREKRRKAVATCLLQDAQRLESDLRQVFETVQPSRGAIHRPKLFWDHIAREVAEFSPVSVNAVAEMYRRVDHFYGAFEQIRIRLGTGPYTDRMEHQIRSHAAFALQLVPIACKALVAEGGEIVGDSDWKPTRFPELPAVPSPVFTDTERWRRMQQSPGASPDT